MFWLRRRHRRSSRLWKLCVVSDKAAIGSCRSLAITRRCHMDTFFLSNPFQCTQDHIYTFWFSTHPNHCKRIPLHLVGWTQNVDTRIPLLHTRSLQCSYKHHVQSSDLYKSVVGNLFQCSLENMRTPPSLYRIFLYLRILSSGDDGQESSVDHPNLIRRGIFVLSSLHRRAPSPCPSYRNTCTVQTSTYLCGCSCCHTLELERTVVEVVERAKQL